jgi:peptidoglycan/xylan/chitin deacetylase (PgdA/CDA1 family)
MSLAWILGAAGVAAGAASWGACDPRSQLFGPTRRHSGSKTSVTLTFDDGPNPNATPALLDLLDRYQVRASFFLIGRYVRLYPQLAAEVGRRGHILGNHTESHCNLIWQSGGNIGRELALCQEAITTATGESPRWMRPPYGFRSPLLQTVVKRSGLDGVVMWSVSAKDWDPQPAARVVRRLAQVKGGDMVLLHDGDSRRPDADRSHTLQALEHWIPIWKDRGWQMVGF